MTPAYALEVATKAHLGQVDKLGNDYITHPVRVAANFTHDQDLQSVALLHDVLEDSEATEEELRKQFSSQVVDAVVVITKKQGQNYEEYLGLVKANKLALTVKLADIADNVRRLDQLTDLVTKDRLTKKYQQAMNILGQL